jgi:hypothetical protein
MGPGDVSQVVTRLAKLLCVFGCCEQGVHTQTGFWEECLEHNPRVTHEVGAFVLCQHASQMPIKSVNRHEQVRSDSPGLAGGRSAQDRSGSALLGAVWVSGRQGTVMNEFSSSRSKILASHPTPTAPCLLAWVVVIPVAALKASRRSSASRAPRPCSRRVPRSPWTSPRPACSSRARCAFSTLKYKYK